MDKKKAKKKRTSIKCVQIVTPPNNLSIDYFTIAILHLYYTWWLIPVIVDIRPMKIIIAIQRIFGHMPFTFVTSTFIPPGFIEIINPTTISPTYTTKKQRCSPNIYLKLPTVVTIWTYHMRSQIIIFGFTMNGEV